MYRTGQSTAEEDVGNNKAQRKLATYPSLPRSTALRSKAGKSSRILSKPTPQCRHLIANAKSGKAVRMPVPPSHRHHLRKNKAGAQPLTHPFPNVSIVVRTRKAQAGLQAYMHVYRPKTARPSEGNKTKPRNNHLPTRDPSLPFHTAPAQLSPAQTWVQPSIRL
jgi:hypothetical protein